MEEENRRARRAARREYCEGVRELVAFVRKRDKRVARAQVRASSGVRACVRACVLCVGWVLCAMTWRARGRTSSTQAAHAPPTPPPPANVRLRPHTRPQAEEAARRAAQQAAEAAKRAAEKEARLRRAAAYQEPEWVRASEAAAAAAAAAVGGEGSSSEVRRRGSRGWPLGGGVVLRALRWTNCARQTPPSPLTHPNTHTHMRVMRRRARPMRSSSSSTTAWCARSASGPRRSWQTTSAAGSTQRRWRR
jgi:hypothetical protein